MSFDRAEHELMRHQLPFRPLEYRQEEHRWRFWCPNLGRDGRCGDYENRPQLCRDYRPAQDGLCVHYWPNEAEPELEPSLEQMGDAFADLPPGWRPQEQST